MAQIYIPSRTSTREIPPPGMHRGVCYLIAELGTQPTSFGPKPKPKPKPQLLMMFELMEPFSPSGKPYALARRYTLTSARLGKLWQDLESWFGRVLTDEALTKINLAQLIGAVATVVVKHELRGDKTYANTTSLIPPAPGTAKRATPTLDPVAFSLSEGHLQTARQPAKRSGLLCGRHQKSPPNPERIGQ